MNSEENAAAGTAAEGSADEKAMRKFLMKPT